MTKEEIKRQKLRSRSQATQPPATRKIAGRKHPGPPKHPKRQRQEEENS